MSTTRSQFDIRKILEISRNRNRPHTDDPFEGIPVSMGMALYIETRVSPSEVRPMQTQLVGYMQGQYLVMTTPRIDGMSLKYNDNQLLAVYFIHDRTVYSFKTRVLRHLGPPFYMSIFQAPEVVEETPLRGASRISVGIPFDRPSGDPQREFILNLSGTGALLRLSSKMPINSVLTLSFFLPNGVSVTNIPCQVKRVDMSNNRMLTGVEFEFNHEDFPAIGQYMDFVLGAMDITQEAPDSLPVRREAPELFRNFG